MLIAIKRNPRYPEYDKYLIDHIEGVKRAWEEWLKPALDKNGYNTDGIDEEIRLHDASKYNADEYWAYCNYFYPSPGFPKSQDAFDKAWLLHQHRNPHHHQYWVLIRDEGEKQPLNMPFMYICSMLCDWQSFSYFRDPESTASAWYKKNGGNMVFSDDTRSIIEEILSVTENS